MNSAPLLFLGIFFTLVSSFWGLVLVPQNQIGQQQQVVLPSGAPYPAPRPGLAQAGADFYRASGCADCHTRQVRGYGGDLRRGWGIRYTVAQDYLYDYPVMLGNLRVGPDLANIGTRATEMDLYKHLYDPQLVTKGSMMPPYKFLFTTRKLRAGQAPSSGLSIAKKDGEYEVVPRHEARALVAYLMSQRADANLQEAPTPKPPAPPEGATNAPAGGATNAPAAATNAPAQP